jgi:hypothetical protein
MSHTLGILWYVSLMFRVQSIKFFGLQLHYPWTQCGTSLPSGHCATYTLTAYWPLGTDVTLRLWSFWPSSSALEYERGSQFSNLFANWSQPSPPSSHGLSSSTPRILLQNHKIWEKLIFNVWQFCFLILHKKKLANEELHNSYSINQYYVN